MASASTVSPQTFNRYSYALNNPYRYTDPSGMEPKWGGYEVRRPDEDQFVQHTEHFLVIDHALETFCLHQGFTLDKNLHRTPSRVLRRRGNLEQIIDIYQEGNWVNTDYHEELPHTFAVAAYYEAAPNDDYLYKLEATLTEHEKFTDLVENLPDYFTRSLQVFSSWMPNTFLEKGLRIENLRK